MSVQDIHDLVRNGRMTAADGARLLEYRAELAWKREPLWFRIVSRLAQLLGGRR